MSLTCIENVFLQVNLIYYNNNVKQKLCNIGG